MFLQKINGIKRPWKMLVMQMVYIFLPVGFFGGIGWFIDIFRDSKPLFLLIGIGLAFFITNTLFYFQFRTLSSEMGKISSENLKKKENISDQSH
ncbi:MAG: hypothetical protein EOM19_03435 [Candidatus Moranbacteria bacterium]|nr:hypothetical protein [Candidatus Moranbacteria bacterium]